MVVVVWCAFLIIEAHTHTPLEAINIGAARWPPGSSAPDPSRITQDFCATSSSLSSFNHQHPTNPPRCRVASSYSSSPAPCSWCCCWPPAWPRRTAAASSASPPVVSIVRCFVARRASVATWAAASAASRCSLTSAINSIRLSPSSGNRPD